MVVIQSFFFACENRVGPFPPLRVGLGLGFVSGSSAPGATTNDIAARMKTMAKRSFLNNSIFIWMYYFGRTLWTTRRKNRTTIRIAKSAYVGAQLEQVAVFYDTLRLELICFIPPNCDYSITRFFWFCLSFIAKRCW